jgi:hypothetical protein
MYHLKEFSNITAISKRYEKKEFSASRAIENVNSLSRALGLKVITYPLTNILKGVVDLTA